jgi:hypothetical protein
VIGAQHLGKGVHHREHEERSGGCAHFC